MSTVITVLGSGTSQGVPVIACDCSVCRSDDPRDERLRSSIHVEHNGLHIQIDCGPDFRQQMIKNQVSKVDVLLMTHEHNDHMIGLDDLRPIMFRQRKPISIYAMPRVLKEIKERFKYAFTPQPYPGAPKFDLFEMKEQVNINGVHIQAIDLMHGHLPILGYRIGNFAYLTDVKTIDISSIEKLKNLDILLLDALHHQEHHAHLTLVESIKYAQLIGAKKTYFIHMSHHMGLHEDVDNMLPEGMSLCHDGAVYVVEN